LYGSAYLSLTQLSRGGHDEADKGGDRRHHGHVEGISRGITDRDNPSGPELLANVNPTFEWVRLAQRIPARIHIDGIPDGVQISSGMTCTVVVRRAAHRWATPALIQQVLSAFGRQARE